MDDEVRIPIFLDLEDTDFEKKLSNLNPKLEKLKTSMQEIAKSRSKTENWNPVDVVKLKMAINSLDEIRQRVLAIGEINMSDKDWSKTFDKYQEGVEVLDTLIGKYQSLRYAMLDIPKDWSGITNAKALAQYIDAVNGRLSQTVEMIESIPKGVVEGDSAIGSNTSKIEDQITSLNELIAKIGEYQQKLAESEINARERTKEISTMKNGGYSKEAIDAQKQIAKAARDSHAELQKSSSEATNAIKKDIQERIAAIKEEEKAIAERIQQLKSEPSADSRRASHNVSDMKYMKSVEDLSQAERNLADSTRDATSAENEQSNAVKQSAAQFYYKLRAVKMLGFVFNSAYNAVDNFGKKSLDVAKKSARAYASLLPGVSLFRLASLRAARSQNELSSSMKSSRKEIKSSTKEIKSSTKAHETFNFSLKKIIKSILAYGFGIRSLYMLMRRLRSAIKDGIGEMSQQFDDVNTKMSSILTSINYIKASLTTVVEPLLTLVAPALEKISELVANISYHVASFIAALSGQKNVYKAVKVQADYAASLDKTAKNAKKAKKELAGFDELNVLHSDDDDNDKAPTMGWELVPALEEAFPLLDKIKDVLGKLLQPLKDAWEKMKDFVLQSWGYAIEKLKSLFGTIWDDFLKVWQDPKTQKIFEDLFKILGDIGLIIGNLAGAFEEAWKHNDNGYRTLSAIRDIIGIIVDGIKRCADATVEWSEKINFTPLFDAIADVLTQQVVPAVQKIVDLFVYLYTEAVLPFATYLIETLAPILVKIIGNVAEIIGILAQKIQAGLEYGENLQKILDAIESILTTIATTLLNCTESTKAWAEKLDVTTLITAIANVLKNDVAPAVEKVSGLFEYLYNTVVLELARYLIEELAPTLVNTFGNIITTIGNIASNIKSALEEGEKGKIIVEAIEKIVSTVADGIEQCSQKTKEWSEKINFNPLFEAIANVLTNQVAPATEKLKDLFVYLYENIILPLGTYIIETLGPKVVEIFGNIIELIGNISENIKKALEENDRGQKILEAIEKIIGYITDKVVDVTAKTKEWAKELDFSKITESTLRFLEKSDPAIQAIVDMVANFWTEVLLPFWKYMIEDGGPKLLDILGDILDNMDWGQVKESTDIFFEAFEQFLELSWDTLLQILKDIGDNITEFVNSGNLKTIVEWFKEWVDDADPEELAKKIEKFVLQFAELYAELLVVSKIIAPVVTGLMTLANVFVQTSLISNVGKLTAAVGGTGAGAGAGTGLAGALGGLAIPIGIVITAISAMVISFGGIKNTIEELKIRFDAAKDAITQFAERINFGDKLDRLKETFDRIKTSLEDARPIFEFLLDVLFGIAQVITETVMGAVGGLLTIIDGSINIIKGFVTTIGGVLEMVGGLVLWFAGDPDGAKALAEEGWSTFVNGLGEIIWGIVETVEGMIEGVANAFAGFVDLALPGVSEKISKFTEDVQGFFENLKHVLIGDPIVYDIRDGVIEGFGEFVSETISSVGGWIKDITGNFTELKTDIVTAVTEIKDTAVEKFETLKTQAAEKFSTLKENLVDKATTIKDNLTNKFENIKTSLSEKSEGVKTYVVEKFTALKDGMLRQSDDATSTTEKNFSDMDKNIKKDINSTSLESSGTEYIQGLESGVDSKFPNFISKISKDVASLLKGFTDVFNSNTLNMPGKSYIDGLQKGATTAWNIFNNYIQRSVSALISYIKRIFNAHYLVSDGKSFISGLNSGISTAWTEMRSSLTGSVNSLIKYLESVFNRKTLVSPGRQFIQGLDRGIQKEFIILMKDVKKCIFELRAEFASQINEHTLYDAGIQCMEGLRRGLLSKLEDTLDDVRRICHEIKSTAEDALGIASPSKEFRRIGEYIMKGLDVGINVLTGPTLDDVYNMLSAILELGEEFEVAFDLLWKEFVESFVKNIYVLDNTILIKVYDIIKHISEEINKDGYYLISSVDELCYGIVDKVDYYIYSLYHVVADGYRLLYPYINTRIGQITSLVDDYVRSLYRTVDQYIGPESLYNLGKQFIEGLINGMEFETDDLYGKVKEIASIIYDSFTGNTWEYKHKLMIKGIDPNSMALTANTLYETGRQLIGGLKAGMQDAADKLKYSIDSIIQELFSQVSGESDEFGETYKNALNEETLYETGQLVMEGLIKGIKSKETDLSNAVMDICNTTVQTFNDSLGIASPSKVTKEIGNYLMLGLEEGILNKQEDIEEEFSDMDFDLDNHCEDVFLKNLIDMKDNAISIISDMANDMETIMNNINFLSSVNVMQSNLKKLENTHTPLIVSGKVLPTSAEFAKANKETIDYNKIGEMIKSAFIEGMSAMSYNNSNDTGDIVIKLDSYEIFRATRDQNNRFSYSTGYSAF